MFLLLGKERKKKLKFHLSDSLFPRLMYLGWKKKIFMVLSENLLNLLILFILLLTFTKIDLNSPLL